MVPRFVVLLADLPVTERGKLDVAALPDPPPRPAPRPPADRWQEAVGAVWSAVLGVDQVDPAEQFIELGGDSLATEEMLTRIAEDLSVSLTMSDLAEHPSLAEFAARAAAVQDVSGTGTVSHSPTMVTLRSSGDRAPVFCFAGAATHGLAFAGLARALGPDHPVHAFHASGLTARGPIDWTIRGSARRHVRDVLRVVPAHQPIVLVGHSLGGLIALEAAQQLAAAGRQVSNLIILDAYLPPRHGGYVGEWARLRADARLGRATDAQEPTGAPPRSVWELAVHVLKTQDLQTLRTRLLLPLAGIMRFGPETTNRIFWQHSFWLSRTARPRAWPGRALVLYTDENPDDLDNWNALLTGEHEIHRVEGDHAGILRPPYLAAVGERVRCFLG